MAKCGFIRDGYSRTGFIKETEFHPALKFTYRPMLGIEWTQLSRQITECGRASIDGKTDKGVAEGERLAFAEVAKRILSWDLVDDAGEKVPVTAANMERVEMHLSGRLMGVINGTDVSDQPNDVDAAKN